MTQLTQALCVQYAAEHTRRMQPRTEGCLYWQLNDMWPAATWSSIDCFGRWKALQHLARRFFAPVLVSGVEDALAGTVAIHLSNHQPDALRATVRWRATDCAGVELLTGSVAVEVPSQTDRQATVLDCRPLRTRLGAHLVHGDAPGPKGSLGMHAGDLDLLIWLEAEAGGRVLSRNLVLFARPKHLRLADDPGLTVALAEAGPGAVNATISAAKPSLWNRLELDGEDVALSDNWFHLDGRTAHTVSVTPGRPMDAAEVRRRLRVVPLVGNG
jgi:beta-mannosidase